jgi:hypothetical protein
MVSGIGIHGLPGPELTPYSDEARFILRGSVKSQGNRYWSTENPRSVHEVPLHDLKAGVWCAIRVRRVNGPVFSFRETIYSERYVSLVLSPFFDQLIDGEKWYGAFMPNNATTHTANNSLDALDETSANEL